MVKMRRACINDNMEWFDGFWEWMGAESGERRVATNKKIGGGRLQTKKSKGASVEVALGIHSEAQVEIIWSSKTSNTEAFLAM